MNRIETLAKAIEWREGFAQGNRSWRNNNPGNLRASPFNTRDVEGFASFVSYQLGWYALTWDLTMKCEGKTITGLSGKSTLRELIQKWAPREDGNDTEKYLADVVKYTGYGADTPLYWLLKTA